MEDEVFYKTLKRECMGIINQLFDLAEVSVIKRQEINDQADQYLYNQFIRLFKNKEKWKREFYV
jgi:hypothetical protein